MLVQKEGFWWNSTTAIRKGSVESVVAAILTAQAIAQQVTIIVSLPPPGVLIPWKELYVQPALQHEITYLQKLAVS